MMRDRASRRLLWGHGEARVCVCEWVEEMFSEWVDALILSKFLP